MALQGPEMFQRFLQAVAVQWLWIRHKPLLGMPQDFSDPLLARICACAIIGFERFLLFYRQVGNDIEAIRLLDGLLLLPVSRPAPVPLLGMMACVDG